MSTVPLIYFIQILTTSQAPHSLYLTPANNYTISFTKNYELIEAADKAEITFFTRQGHLFVKFQRIGWMFYSDAEVRFDWGCRWFGQSLGYCQDLGPVPQQGKAMAAGDFDCEREPHGYQVSINRWGCSSTDKLRNKAIWPVHKHRL